MEPTVCGNGEDRLRLYRPLDPSTHWLGKMTLHLPDRPGSIAALAGACARRGLNIVLFEYDRSLDPQRVLLEVEAPDGRAIREGWKEMETLAAPDPGGAFAELALEVLDPRNVLSLTVELEHRPGTLAGFADLLAERLANVIHFSYHEGRSATTAIVSIALRRRGEVGPLLELVAERGYRASVRYRGVGRRQVEDVIGLTLAESFYQRMLSLLGTDDLAALRKLVDSSRRLSEMLVRFASEAGKDLAVGDVFTTVLAFASSSRSRTGRRFTWRRLPPWRRGTITLHVFRLPTGANFSLLESGNDLTLVDGGYGLYFRDVLRMLGESGFDPARVGRVFLTHADADHAGMAGAFADRFGSRVHLHRGAAAVLAGENRLAGSNSPLEELNRCFTVLVNGFTEFQLLENWVPLAAGGKEMIGGFPLAGRFSLGEDRLAALECTGGHTPGQIFYLVEEAGILFTGDYLLHLESLSDEECQVLNYPKKMMTSTNAHSQLFREEMDRLARFVGEFAAGGRELFIVPGHGAPYPASALAAGRER